ncbi:MAG: hypothetical protein DLM58_20870 [Pseudonocardiales bacterium]|nr:MAG: hypothetical protein DLM58_20870 [Pseudonocardiales bacterium]
MDPTVSTGQAELAAVRARRAELRESMGRLERALAAPAAGRAVVWGELVHAVLIELAEDFQEHIEVTEGTDGLHQAILAGDLRLANAVTALAVEHSQIAGEVDDLVAGTEPPVTAADAEDARRRGTGLLGRLVRHRQRGADLIYEAYQTDIGGGD